MPDRTAGLLCIAWCVQGKRSVFEKKKSGRWEMRRSPGLDRRL